MLTIVASTDRCLGDLVEEASSSPRQLTRPLIRRPQRDQADRRREPGRKVSGRSFPSHSLAERLVQRRIFPRPGTTVHGIRQAWRLELESATAAACRHPPVQVVSVHALQHDVAGELAGDLRMLASGTPVEVSGDHRQADDALVRQRTWATSPVLRSSRKFWCSSWTLAHSWLDTGAQ